MNRTDIPDSTLAKVFTDLAARLTSGYPATSLRGNTPPIRTSSNREYLVKEFLQNTLPLSVEIRQGATLIDSFDQESRDIDLVLLNPWATPVWPFQHGVVPIEGVLYAVLVESAWPSPGKLAAVWQQNSSIKKLVKWTTPDTVYAWNVRRAFRAESGIWCWCNGGTNVPTPKSIMTRMKDPLVQDDLNNAFQNSVTKAKDWEVTQPATTKLRHPSRDKMKDDSFQKYLRAIGAFYPDWLYFHAIKKEERLLLVKFCGRDNLLIKGGKATWKRGTVRKAARKELVCSSVSQYVWLNSKQDVQEKPNMTQIQWGKNCSWAYACYQGKDIEPLQVLALQFAHGTTRYGFERPDYSRYLKIQG